MTRVDALDFVKGSLVLLMVIYHWLNYFVRPDWDVYRYLRFLTPSFIFITGFLVAHVYLPRYASSRRRVTRRLVWRGFKLVLLFVTLNMLADFAIGPGVSGQERVVPEWVGRSASVLIWGQGRAAFSILVPIGYFLLLAPLVLCLYSQKCLPAWLAAGVAVGGLIASEAFKLDNANVSFLAFALVGFAAGAGAITRMDWVPEQALPLVVAYAGYVVAITVWNVRLPLQLVGVCLSVALLYGLGVSSRSDGRLYRTVIELGHYSLFCYVLQIVVLQLLRHLWASVHAPVGAALAAPCAIALAMMVGAVFAIGVFRRRSSVADRLYRSVFA